MENKVLFETRVNKYSTCLSYALDRTGKSDAYKFISEIPKDKYIPLREHAIKVGDIVAWKNKIPTKLYNTSILTIDKYPILVQNLEETEFHFGVVERITSTGKMIVSDCTRSQNPNYFPEIRLRLLDIYFRDHNELKLPEYIVNI